MKKSWGNPPAFSVSYGDADSLGKNIFFDTEGGFDEDEPDYAPTIFECNDSAIP